MHPDHLLAHPRPRRFAVARLHLPDGIVLRRQVVVVDETGSISYHPLVAEEPFVEWRGGDYYLCDTQ